LVFITARDYREDGGKPMAHASAIPGDEDSRLLAEATLLTAECARTCLAGAYACLAEREVESLRRCVRLTMDCADTCEAAGRLLLRPQDPDHEVLRLLLEAVSIACRTCAAECGRHAARFEHCRLCYEVCTRCADACTRLREALDRAPPEPRSHHDA
jgi:hypothetical protein